MQKIYLQIPDELQTDINHIKSELADLKKSFEPKNPTEYLTRQQTADLLHVDLTSIWNYTNKKILKSYGIQGRVLYKRVEVEDAIIRLNK